MCGNIHVTYKSIVQFFKFVNSDILHGMWENQTIRGKKNIELAKYTNQHLRNIIIRKRQGNNMVTLKNIRKTENDISADYYIEGNPEKGFIKINTLNGEVIEHKSVGYGYSHAIYELEQLATLDNPPTEIIVFWY